MISDASYAEYLDNTTASEIVEHRTIIRDLAYWRGQFDPPRSGVESVGRSTAPRLGTQREAARIPQPRGHPIICISREPPSLLSHRRVVERTTFWRMGFPASPPATSVALTSPQAGSISPVRSSPFAFSHQKRGCETSAKPPW